MSQNELQRVKVIENAVERRITVEEASLLLKLSRRQVKRLKSRYCAEGVEWVRHGNRGREKPWKLAEATRERIVKLAKEKYEGFNDSHLSEKLKEVEGIEVSRETVRRVLRLAGVTRDRRFTAGGNSRCDKRESDCVPFCYCYLPPRQHSPSLP